jgi:hypothetical protein
MRADQEVEVGSHSCARVNSDPFVTGRWIDEPSG